MKYLMLLLLITSCTSVTHNHYWVIDASGDIQERCKEEKKDSIPVYQWNSYPTTIPVSNFDPRGKW